MEPETRTLSAAVREHLRQLCLHEFPCGTGSWVRALAGRPGEGLGGLGNGGDRPGARPGLLYQNTAEMEARGPAGQASASPDLAHTRALLPRWAALGSPRMAATEPPFIP